MFVEMNLLFLLLLLLVCVCSFALPQLDLQGTILSSYVNCNFDLFQFHYLYKVLDFSLTVVNRDFFRNLIQ